MEDLKVVSAKIPEELYKEMILRVSEGERSSFIREAIIEKLQTLPRPDIILELQTRMDKLEEQMAHLKKHMMDLELLTFENQKVDTHAFCSDELDHSIIDSLIHYKGATTPELARYLETNRWVILGRLKRMQKTSEKKLGRPLIYYSPEKRSGKRKAWWLNEDLIEG